MAYLFGINVWDVRRDGEGGEGVVDVEHVVRDVEGLRTNTVMIRKQNNQPVNNLHTRIQALACF